MTLTQGIAGKRKHGNNYRCINCDTIVKMDMKTCPSCMADIVDSIGKDEEIINPIKGDDEQLINSIKTEKYPSLKLIAGIYRVIAWVIGIGAIIAFVYGFDLLGDRYNKDAGVLIIVYSIVTGTLGVIFTLAVSEGIVLFVNIANDVNAIKNRK